MVLPKRSQSTNIAFKWNQATICKLGLHCRKEEKDLKPNQKLQLRDSFINAVKVLPPPLNRSFRGGGI